MNKYYEMLQMIATILDDTSLDNTQVRLLIATVLDQGGIRPLMKKAAQ